MSDPKQQEFPDPDGSPDIDEETFEEEVDDGSPQKTHSNIVFVGHVDSGKSTTCGRILVDKGVVEKRAIGRVKQDEDAQGGEEFIYAQALDELEEERRRSKTFECGHSMFETETKLWNVIDAPGHRQFVPHMIGGTSQAEVAVLIISARKGEFETGFEKDGQTREHIVLTKTLGVTHLIVAINKMDDETVHWDQGRYTEIKDKLSPFLKQSGWRPADVRWLPISGLKGENVLHRTDKSPWYNGPCLIEVLESLTPPERMVNAPPIFTIQEKYKESGDSNILGKLEVGTIKAGDEMLLMPINKQVKVKAVKKGNRTIEMAQPGDQVTITLTGIDEQEISRGYVLCSRTNPIHATNLIEAQFMIMECKSVMTKGYEAVLHVHAATAECIMTQISAVLDKQGKVAQKNPDFVKQGQTIICRFKTDIPICVEPFKVLQPCGRFVIRDEGRTIGIGKIIGISVKGDTKASAPQPSNAQKPQSSPSPQPDSNKPSPASVSTEPPQPKAPAKVDDGLDDLSNFQMISAPKQTALPAAIKQSAPKQSSQQKISIAFEPAQTQPASTISFTPAPQQQSGPILNASAKPFSMNPTAKAFVPFKIAKQ
ncbi:putative Eukaryotic peptide chain release factor GTP-binding subunit ERF3A [Blattamonas nauphoetae]|uniref:Eukaryotic peptide chain release factor GTP-binding subunit ERF3A n=1 Tax=Blattamonas nauphoetae TaxID=2049346 RepID=A0ABQ9XYZ4_9EUKA|nr:putative Eukaryotic peptide chain release factor GTP-binding subunit ERF3A [Blattamonas nauphoetae]